MTSKAEQRVWSVVANEAERINRSEIVTALQLLGLNPTKDAIRDFCGKDDKRTFTRQDLSRFVQLERGKSEDALKTAISDIKSMLGLTEDTVTMKELRTLLLSHGDAMTSSEVDKLFQHLDLDTTLDNITFSELEEQVISTSSVCMKVFINNSTNKTLQQHQTWFTKKLKGFFLLNENGILSTRYSFNVNEKCDVTIKVSDAQINNDSKVDVTLFLLKADNTESVDSFSIIGVSESNVGETVIHCHDLEPSSSSSSYLIVALTTGAILKKRKNQLKLKKLADQDHGELCLSKLAEQAIREVFDRFDVSGGGTLSRGEYDLLQLCTDGEVSDDDTWAFILENMEVENQSLTFKGFLQLYTQVLQATEGGDSEFYKNFASLGFNQHLQVDEAATFVCSIAAPRNSLITDFKTLSHNTAQAEQIWLNLLQETGKQRSFTNEPKVLWLSDNDNNRSSFAVVNQSRKTVVVEFDVSASKNFLSSCDDLKTTVEVEPGSRVLGPHLICKDKKAKTKLVARATLL